MDESRKQTSDTELSKTPLRRTFYFIFAALILLVVFELGLSLRGRQIDGKVFESQQTRYLSYLIADELRQSSDDLTRMARLHAATSDPAYEQYYRDIIAIRDGKRPRPKGYDKIYWDLVLAIGHHTEPSQTTVSLEQLFQVVGVPDEELALLNTAKKNSDLLVELETAAMNAVNGRFPDAMGRYTLRGPSNTDLALRLLTNSDYILAKAQIMKPIRDFQVLLDQRTKRKVQELKSEARSIARIEIGLAVAIVFLMVLAFIVLNRHIIEPILDLTRAAANFGRQGFFNRTEPTHNNELGTLRRTLNQMSVSIEEQLGVQKAAEEKFRHLIEAAPDALVISDEHGEITLINKEAEKLFGYAREELVGQKIETLVPDSVRERHPDLRDSFHGNPGAYQIGGNREINARRKDGSEVAVDISVSPIDVEGNQKLLCSSIRDVSERRESQRAIAKQLAFQKAILHTIPYPMFIKDSEARFIGCNQAYVEAFGTSAEFLQGKTVLDLDYIATEARDKFHQEDIGAIENASRVSYELPITYQDGTEHVTLYTADGFRMPDGSAGGLIGLMVDITDRKRAEEELNRSQKLVQGVMDNTNAIIFVKDDQGRYVMVNRQWCETVNVLRSDAIGRTDHEIFPKEMADAYSANDQIVRESRALHTSEESGVFDGRSAHFVSSKFPLFDDEGQMFAMAGVSTDITEFKETQRQIETQRHLFQAIIDNAGAFIYVKDPQSRYLFVNRNYEELLGLPANEIIGKTSHEILDQAQADSYERGDERVRESLQPFESEVEAMIDGEKRHFLAHKFPLLDDDGNLFATAGVSSDFTDLKRTHEELAKAKETADTANEAKSAFLATMSHEIRTPMNAIINMVGLALETKLTNKQNQYLSVADSSARGLLALINDILDFSKIEAGRMDLEMAPFDLRKLLEEIADSFRGRVLEKHLELIVYTPLDVPDVLIGDSLRLRQVLINLIGNAFKFTEHGEVAVRLKLLEDTLPGDNGEDGEVLVEVTVSDTGLGIPEEALKKLGEAFTQADSSTARKHGGTGLGLAISRRLIGMMGGELAISSEEGKGSEFSFKTRFGYRGNETHSNNRAPEQLANANVLVVEDNETSQELFGTLFESFGMKCQVVESAEAGWEHLRKSDYGLVVLDWMLPGEDGLALAKRIRDDENYATLPLIMVSCFAGKEEEAMAKAIGVNAFVSKPITASMLFDSIVEVMNVSGDKQADKPDSQTHDENEFAGKRVLLAEDNEANQFVAEEILTRSGITIEIANNGLEAVDLVARNEYDAVLMDMQMPEMDGLEATRVIRENHPDRTIPIIALTANAMQSDLEACQNAGMDDYVAKPIDRKLLFQVLRKWLIKQDTSSSEREWSLPDSDSISSEQIEENAPSLAEDSPEEPQSDSVEVAEEAPVDTDKTDATAAGSSTDSDSVKEEEQTETTPSQSDSNGTIEKDGVEESVELPPIEIGATSETKEKAKPKRAKKKGAAKTKKKKKADNLQPDLFGNLDDPDDVEGSANVSVDDEGVPSLPGVDFRDAIGRLGLPVDSIKKMVIRFADSLSEMVQELNSSLDSKDDESARRHAHSIAGAAGNLSADTLRRHAKTLELAIKFGQGGYKKMLEDLEREAARIMSGVEQLKTLIGESGEKYPKPPQPSSPEDLRKLHTVFEELIESLNEGDLEAIAQAAGRIKSLTLPESVQSDFERLTELVDAFDYADAVELARSMQSRI